MLHIVPCFVQCWIEYCKRSTNRTVRFGTSILLAAQVKIPRAERTRRFSFLSSSYRRINHSNPHHESYDFSKPYRTAGPRDSRHAGLRRRGQPGSGLRQAGGWPSLGRLGVRQPLAGPSCAMQHSIAAARPAGPWNSPSRFGPGHWHLQRDSHPSLRAHSG